MPIDFLAPSQEVRSTNKAWVAVLALAMILILPEIVFATEFGPDTQASPQWVERYTDTFWIAVWGLLFFALSCTLPFLGLAYLAHGGRGMVAGGMLYGFSEQVRRRQPLNPMAAFGHGLIAYFAPPLFLIFIGPFGLYQLAIKPILLRTDEASATVCCFRTLTPTQDILLSNDGRWLLGHTSHSTPIFGKREAAGEVFLVDAWAGAFVQFRNKNGERSPFWLVGEGVREVGWLMGVSWDSTNGRYLRAEYRERGERKRFEDYDLQSIGLGPMLIDRPMVPVAESFSLTSFDDETATFTSLKRSISLNVGGEVVSVDASGTVAAVIAHDPDSWVDAGTLAFWHLPTGQRIRQYKVNYLPSDPVWKASYGGDVWVYLIDGHVKIFRPTEGWSPVLESKYSVSEHNGEYARLLANG